jgi:hypothetical protein
MRRNLPRLLVAVSVASLASFAQAASYGVIDIGTSFTGVGLNDSGVVAGSDGSHAAIWSGGSITLLSNGGLVAPATALGVSSSGVILGESGGPTYTGLGGVVTWSDASASPTVIAASTSNEVATIESDAIAINSSGQIVYKQTIHSGSPPPLNPVSYLWSPSTGTATSLGLAADASFSSIAVDLNDNGAVLLTFGGAVGVSQAGVSSKVTSGFSATALNNVGDIVGNTFSGVPMFWNGSANISLGEGVAEDVNDAGMVVGRSSSGSALLWTSATSPAVALDSLVDSSSGWHFTDALKINNKGQILALGTLGSDTSVHTVLLQAVPEPGVYAFMLGGLGILFLAGARCKAREVA